MNDKNTDLLVVISEVLHKQDIQTEQIKELADRVDKSTEQIKFVAGRVDVVAEKIDFVFTEQKKTNEILSSTQSMLSKQFEAQHLFNQQFFDELKQIKTAVEKFTLLEERIKHLEGLEERVNKIEQLLKAS